MDHKEQLVTKQTEKWENHERIMENPVDPDIKKLSLCGRI